MKGQREIQWVNSAKKIISITDLFGWENPILFRFWNFEKEYFQISDITFS